MPDAAAEPRLGEDHLSERGPAALALGGPVVDADGALDDLVQGRRQIDGVGRRAALVVDDGDLLARGAEREHRAQEVVPDRPEEPGGADDPRLAARGGLAE